jgi:GNAT superfamily N-acetyltransferase
VLNEKQFPYTYTYSNDGHESLPEHTVTAHHKGKSVGFLTFSHSGPVLDVQVDKEHRRKGVATGMWNYALSLGGTTFKSSGIRIPNVEHSENRTEGGEEWAKSTGKAHYFPPEEIH